MKKLLSVLSVFAVAAIAAGTASAGMIDTPAGLNAGDHFRIVFETSTNTSASSTDIETYDSFVSADAAGTTYNGNPLLWQAIVSIGNTNARDLIGISSSSTIPSYLVNGTKESAGNLWSGSLLHVVDGTASGGYHESTDWQFTGSDGGKGGSIAIAEDGHPPLPYGDYPRIDKSWTEANATVTAESTPQYGNSPPLTVLSADTEPSTAVSAGLGGLAALAYSFKRKRNSCRR